MRTHVVALLVVLAAVATAALAAAWVARAAGAQCTARLAGVWTLDPHFAATAALGAAALVLEPRGAGAAGAPAAVGGYLVMADPAGGLVADQGLEAAPSGRWRRAARALLRGGAATLPVRLRLDPREEGGPPPFPDGAGALVLAPGDASLALVGGGSVLAVFTRDAVASAAAAAAGPEEEEDSAPLTSA